MIESRRFDAREVWGNVMASHSDVSLPWGPTNIDRFLLDPKRIAFFMARYKFAAKMLSRCGSILDVGCGDGMGTATFLSDTNAKQIVGLDFERKVIDYAVGHLLLAVRQVRPDDVERLSFVNRDFADGCNAANMFDGLCCLDVIEHVDPDLAHAFIGQFAFVLKQYGVAVIGTPNRLAERYGSKHSKIGHINLYEPWMLRAALERSFSRVFVFSMNDEVVHTGFENLAHYMLAVCVK